MILHILFELVADDYLPLFEKCNEGKLLFTLKQLLKLPAAEVIENDRFFRIKYLL